MTVFNREDAYRVQLPVFEGPLDLLLQFIEREKLDISAISLAQVADQFLTAVRQMETVEADDLSDFLVIAVKLVWIKSRLLLPQPRPPSDDMEEDGPGRGACAPVARVQALQGGGGGPAGHRGGRAADLHRAAAPPPELEAKLDPGGGLMTELLAAANAAFAALGCRPGRHPEGHGRPVQAHHPRPDRPHPAR